jgi:hypothetical protein
MKQQKPILHGRDHACGGADEIPGICQVYAAVDKLSVQWGSLIGGGDYISIQAGTWTGGDYGPSFQTVASWPAVHVTDIIAHLDAGYELHCRMSANVQHVEDIRVNGEGYGGAIGVSAIPSGDWPIWTHVAADGYILEPPSSDRDETMFDVLVQPAGIPSVSGGVFILTWVAYGDTPPTTATGALYQGSYPIVNGDVSATADIDPTKLAHPGGSAAFLRGDGTWSNPTLEVDY